MASTSQKWFIGCGIGCGLMILITAIIGGGIFFAVKDVVKEGKSIDESNNAMIAAFGMPEEFTPEANGAIAPDRMEIFLASRAASAVSMDEMADILTTLDDDSNKGPAAILAKVKAGVTLVPAILTFINDRNLSLLENGMGDGEYLYIYSLAYFAYLDKDLTDGPSFQVSGNDSGDSDDGVSWNVSTSSDDSDVRDRREKRVRTQIHQMQMGFLMNQIAAMGPASGLDDELRAVLEAEREAMNAARRRLLWEDELPPVIEASLAPYADDLNASYRPILNVIEIGLGNSN